MAPPSDKSVYKIPGTLTSNSLLTFVTILLKRKVPLRDVWHEIPGAAQVDEKGHDGNTAVVTAYLSYVGGNMVKETAGQEFLLTFIIYFEHYIILVQQSCWPFLYQVLFERSEFLIATCKKKKTDRMCGCLCVCTANLGFSVENCLGFSVGYQRAPGAWLVLV